MFNWLKTRDPKKGENIEDEKKREALENKITPGDLSRALRHMGGSPLKSEVADMIWEVDDDLDGMISEDEFMTIYKR